jgi:hypothetical protein
MDETRFHEEFEALTKRQPTKVQGKHIKCEVMRMQQQRTSEKHHVVMVKWPYLAIVGGFGVGVL